MDEWMRETITMDGDIEQWMNLTLWPKFGNINTKIIDLKHAFKYIYTRGTQVIVKL